MKILVELDLSLVNGRPIAPEAMSHALDRLKKRLCDVVFCYPKAGKDGGRAVYCMVRGVDLNPGVADEEEDAQLQADLKAERERVTENSNPHGLTDHQIDHVSRGLEHAAGARVYKSGSSVVLVCENAKEFVLGNCPARKVSDLFRIANENTE